LRINYLKPLPVYGLRPGVFDRIAKLLWVIVLALAIAFCFLASSFCIILVLATFLSILIDPLVSFLEQWRIPRSVSAVLRIATGMLGLGLVAYGSYNRTATFVERFLIYADRIRAIVQPLSQKIAKVEEGAGRLNPEPGKKVTEVKVKQAPSWPFYLVRGFGSASSAILILVQFPSSCSSCWCARKAGHGSAPPMIPVGGGWLPLQLGTCLLQARDKRFPRRGRVDLRFGDDLSGRSVLAV
jgi:AI-2E family transporter